MSHGDSTRAAGRLPMGGWSRAIGLAVFLSAGAMVESVRLESLRNPAVWGHLRDGVWILGHRSVPRTGIFSQAVSLPWRDLSWGYDAIAAILYRTVGLRAVPLLSMGFLTVVAAVLFLLAGGRRGNLWSAALLAGVTVYTLVGVGPAPVGASVILFGMELLLLFAWRRGRNRWAVFTLPLLFLIWANLDSEFVYGMIALALFVLSQFAVRIADRRETSADGKMSGRDALVVFVTCLIASGITPYGFASYPEFWRIETGVANLNIPGYGAMGFRQAVDYVVLLLGMTGFLAMGLRRSRDVFLVALLCGSAALAFHSQRENWLLIMSSAAVIGKMLPGAEDAAATNETRTSGRRPLVIAGLTTAIVGLAFFMLIPRDPKVLMERVARALPVKACDYIRKERPPQPLFNAYEWGAFLTWYLPEYPVAIDGRRGLYPEELESDYFKVMRVELPYQSLPAMKDARTILLEKSNVVAGGLRDVRGFRVAYEDDVAIVLLQGAKE